MGFAITLLCHPAGTYVCFMIAVAGCIYAWHTRSLRPAFAAIAATALTTIAFFAVPPHGIGLALVLLGATLLQVEFLLPTYGAAFIAGFASSTLGSWLMLAPIETAATLGAPARAALALTGTCGLLAAVLRGSRRSTLPAD